MEMSADTVHTRMPEIDNNGFSRVWFEIKLNADFGAQRVGIRYCS